MLSNQFRKGESGEGWRPATGCGTGGAQRRIGGPGVVPRASTAGYGEAAEGGEQRYLPRRRAGVGAPG
jgi:hypothetical protein